MRSNPSGNCPQVGTGWRKSARCGGTDDCVEVGQAERVIVVRDTKDNGTGPVLAFGGNTWGKFIRSLA